MTVSARFKIKTNEHEKKTIYDCSGMNTLIKYHNSINKSSFQIIYM